MGLFDIFFWNREIKTDAERYMEERNAEYRKKKKMYQELELNSIKNSMVEFNRHTTPNQKQQRQELQAQTRTNHVCKNQTNSSLNRNKKDCRFDLNYDNSKACEFEIIASTYDATKKVQRLTGRVTKGRFCPGDIISVGNSLRQEPISEIIRKGEIVDYVNSVSGVVVFVFRTKNQFNVSKGNIIHKDTIL